ncbi:Protein of unknown function [Pyronema omphalodes CBS 100304]|uniref:Uncharacterized protein n=1 Tax=Pyronema omphalodes (strain CBS 100304) TaxID=1076935 RepID=U4LIH4_PYROM|nr:Protein of unknown function [Pyronema omphalodes CBS 100304]
MLISRLSLDTMRHLSSARNND